MTLSVGILLHMLSISSTRRTLGDLYLHSSIDSRNVLRMRSNFLPESCITQLYFRTDKTKVSFILPTSGLHDNKVGTTSSRLQRRSPSCRRPWVFPLPLSPNNMTLLVLSQSMLHLKASKARSISCRQMAGLRNLINNC